MEYLHLWAAHLAVPDLRWSIPSSPPATAMYLLTYPA